MKIKRKVFLLQFLLVLAGCHSSHLKPMAYVTYLENKDNGFRKERIVNNWDYEAQLKPAGYIYLQETKGEGASADGYSQRTGELRGWCFFNVYVSHDSVHNSAPIRLISNNLQDYNTVLSYYLNTNQKNFVLYVDSVAIYPTVYNYENNYNLSPKDEFVVGFDLKKIDTKRIQQLVLAYDDEMLKTGIVKFKFSGADMRKEPSIDFN